ncbi:hypothetical protein DZF91_01740 [Actinomadura logoneensis]|uniref:Uncharacterized protein n=2 Tax=Actinomadura logoneensis TaxID=2293572 RepID=A0A372JVG4_9ACTN|nr:hypothetical protein DZF91_01740 [Actinomadura logoneensis]
MTVRKSEASGPSVPRRDEPADRDEPRTSDEHGVPAAVAWNTPAEAALPAEEEATVGGNERDMSFSGPSPETSGEETWPPLRASGRHRLSDDRYPEATDGLSDRPPTRPDAPATEPEPTFPDASRRPAHDTPEAAHDPSRTRPDTTVPDRSERPGRRPRAHVPNGDMTRLDGRARRALVDEFVGDFVGGPTWQALLVVLEGAFPGLGVGATLATSADEIWREIAPLDERGAVARIGVPLWLGPMGLEVDLSAHRRPASENGGHARPRAARPYAKALVVDTVDPLRYHRPVSGPSAPHDRPGEADPLGDALDFEADPLSDPPTSTPLSHEFDTPFDQPRDDDRGGAHGVEEDDTGVVIVADLTATGVRVLDAPALWRHASRIVAGTLRDPHRPETWTLTRRTLRSLRRVVLLDPRLGLGVCLGLDDRHTARCLLVFRIDRTEVATPRFVRP